MPLKDITIKLVYKFLYSIVIDDKSVISDIYGVQIIFIIIIIFFIILIYLDFIVGYKIS